MKADAQSQGRRGPYSAAKGSARGQAALVGKIHSSCYKGALSYFPEQIILTTERAHTGGRGWRSGAAQVGERPFGELLTVGRLDSRSASEGRQVVPSTPWSEMQGTVRWRAKRCW